MISDEDCDDISINRTGDLFEHRLARWARWAQCVSYLCICMYKYVCVYARSLTPNHILSYLPQLSRLISTTGNWACYDGVYLCNVHKPVVPSAHPLAAQCNVRFVLSSFNPRTMPSPFPCIIELKPVETVKSPRAKFKCKGPRRNDKPKKKLNRKQMNATSATGVRV